MPRRCAASRGRRGCRWDRSATSSPPRTSCCSSRCEVIDQARRRIAAGADARAAAVRDGRAVDAALALLEQVLPLDDKRLIEARVWAAFTGQTVTDAGLAAIRREADDGVRQLSHDCLAGLAQLGDIDLSRDLDVETERLWSLLDGLTMHVLLDPARTPADLVGTALRTHLGDLQTSQRSPS